MATIKLVSLAMIFAGLTQWDSTIAAQSTVNQNQNSYFIQGAVNKPGVYRIEDAPSVLKLIALAGGLSDTHGSTAFIIRRTKPQTERATSEVAAGGEFTLIRLDILGLLKGEFQKDALLKAGDILNIPESEVVIVSGEVNKAGAFPVKEGMTLRQAISLAGGVNYRAKIEELVIFRRASDTGKREEIKVNLVEILSGKAIDPLIKAEDIIVVPHTRAGTRLFPDAPPVRFVFPCRGAGPCVAGLL